MDHIAADVDRQIAADGAGLSFKRLGGPDQLAGTGDHPIAFPNHRHHRAGGDEVNQASKEGALLVYAVMLLSQLAAGGELLQTNKLETLALEASENFTHQPALDAIGLNGDEGTFGGHKKSPCAAPSSVATPPLGKHSIPNSLYLLEILTRTPWS